jgi:hypothetical protein
MERPASTIKVAPVMNDESSEARKRISGILSEKRAWSDEKGPDARRRRKAAGEAYSSRASRSRRRGERIRKSRRA